MMDMVEDMVEDETTPLPKGTVRWPGGSVFYAPAYQADMSEAEVDMSKAEVESVDHPPHYGGGSDPFETIKVIEARGFGFHIGNAYKYLDRAGKKAGTDDIEDLRKAVWYIEREIARLSESGE